MRTRFFCLTFALLVILGHIFDATAQQTCLQPPQGIVSWWQAEGDAMDFVGLNHGSLENGAGFAVGMVGQAFQFDGVNDFVRVPNAPSLNPVNQVSIEFWMKGDAANPMNACCQGLVTTDFYGVEGFDSSRGIGFFLSTNDGTSFPNANTAFGNTGFGLIPGQWHHISATYDGSLMTQYVDGRVTAALALSGNISAMRVGSFLTIGSEDGRGYNPTATANRYFRGLIDEVSIYNRALSQEEVSAIFTAGSKGKCPGVPLANVSASLTAVLGPSSDDDSFDFRATATEGPGSDGLNPFTEDMRLRLGGFSIVIPAGSFTGIQPRFRGIISGINVDASIHSLGGGGFDLRIRGDGADLSDLTSPVNVELTIGDNGFVATLPSVRITAH
jgi:hypothetical protein